MLEQHNGQEGKKTLYLLDAMALAYRSHFIFISRPLMNSKGQNTSASYGFTTALLKLIDEHAMDHLAVVFDEAGEGGTFRSELYEDYKANREAMPDDLAANIPYIKKIVEAFDVPAVSAPGVEADDVIGTLARRAEAEGADVVIVSPDKDFRQLLSDRISIARPAHRGEEFERMTDERFREKYGLEPVQFIDMLALMGDTSDNVPGVPGIGEKTAMKLLQEYGSVETLLEHADDVKGKRAREGLQNHRDDALMSKELVTILTDLDVDLDWHTFHLGDPDWAALTDLFEELEFRSLLGRLKERHEEAGAAGTDVPDYSDDPALSFDFGPYEPVTVLDKKEVEYSIIRTKADLEKLAAELKEKERFAFDTETTSTDPMYASLVGVAFSWEEAQGRYVPTPMPDGTSTDDVLDVLRPVLASETPKVGQNLKYDLLVLAQHGVDVRGPLFDTMVAHYLIAPEEPHNLDAIARAHLSYRMRPITDLIGTGKSQISMRDVPIEDAGPYACEDADVALRLADLLRDELEENGLLEIAETMEFPLIYVLTDMEQAGIRIAPDVLSEISKGLEEQLEGIQARIYEAAGQAFNIGSTQQLSEILFDKLELPVRGKTSTGRPSTKESVLQELATEHALPGLILDWRSLSKLKSTYVDALGELVHPETGRIHTSFNQTVTATGRLSSSNPNLQNIPVRTEIGREIRRAFVPQDGWLLMSADYVQIELRILAAVSEDEALKKAFEEGQDIHTAAASRVYKVPPEKVTRDQRSKSKQVNYGIPYGISAWGLAQRIRSSVKEAQDLIDGYQRSYPQVANYLAMEVEQAREKGYVETLLGRRRYVPGIHSRDRNDRQFAERVATNMPIQGTQADMIKIAMVRIHERMEREGLKSRMLLQVHDELVFEVPPDEEDAMRTLIEEEMTQALPIGVPVEVDVDAGDNWLDAH